MLFVGIGWGMFGLVVVEWMREDWRGNLIWGVLNEGREMYICNICVHIIYICIQCTCGVAVHH